MTINYKFVFSVESQLPLSPLAKQLCGLFPELNQQAFLAFDSEFPLGGVTPSARNLAYLALLRDQCSQIANARKWTLWEYSLPHDVEQVAVKDADGTFICQSEHLAIEIAAVAAVIKARSLTNTL